MTSISKCKKLKFHILLSDGELIVATSSDSLKQPVNINRIHVSLGSCRNKVEIEVKAAQSLFLPSIPPASAGKTDFTILSWISLR